MPDLAKVGAAMRGAVTAARRRSLDPPVRFLLLTSGRSGSTLLISLLESVPGVRCGTEVLRAYRGDPAARLRKIARREAITGATAWGTSVHPEHLLFTQTTDSPAWVEDRHDEGYGLILLTRANAVGTALSVLVAEATGRWHQHAAEGGGEAPAVVIDPARLLKVVLHVEGSTQAARRMVGNRSHLALDYDTDLAEAEGHQVTADRVCAFLGVPSGPVSSTLRKRRVPMLDQVANLDQVRSVLGPTRFGALLDRVDEPRPTT